MSYLRPIKIKNRKGDIFQIFFVLILLFVIAIIGLLIGNIAYKMSKTLNDIGVLDNAPVAKQANQIANIQSYTVNEELIFFFFLGSNIGLLIAASRTKFSSVVIFLFIMLLLFAIIIAAGMVNVYHGIAQDSAFSEYGNRLIITNVLFSKYFPLIVTIIGVIVMMVMYGKSGSEVVI